ncbi:hypothetical protein ACHAWF_006951 [Thalassiosira exigua]
MEASLARRSRSEQEEGQGSRPAGGAQAQVERTGDHPESGGESGWSGPWSECGVVDRGGRGNHARLPPPARRRRRRRAGPSTALPGPLPPDGIPADTAPSASARAPPRVLRRRGRLRPRGAVSAEGGGSVVVVRRRRRRWRRLEAVDDGDLPSPLAGRGRDRSPGGGVASARERRRRPDVRRRRLLRASHLGGEDREVARRLESALLRRSKVSTAAVQFRFRRGAGRRSGGVVRRPSASAPEGCPRGVAGARLPRLPVRLVPPGRSLGVPGLLGLGPGVSREPGGVLRRLGERLGDPHRPNDHHGQALGNADGGVGRAAESVRDRGTLAGVRHRGSDRRRVVVPGMFGGGNPSLRGPKCLFVGSTNDGAVSPGRALDALRMNDFSFLDERTARSRSWGRLAPRTCLIFEGAGAPNHISFLDEGTNDAMVDFLSPLLPVARALKVPVLDFDKYQVSRDSVATGRAVIPLVVEYLAQTMGVS